MFVSFFSIFKNNQTNDKKKKTRILDFSFFEGGGGLNEDVSHSRSDDYENKSYRSKKLHEWHAASGREG